MKKEDHYEIIHVNKDGEPITQGTMQVDSYGCIIWTRAYDLHEPIREVEKDGKLGRARYYS